MSNLRSQRKRQERERSGRYGRDDPDKPASTPGELPFEGRQSAHVHLLHAIVADPNPSLRGKKQRVAVNRLTDALEYEFSRGTISASAYHAGRCWQQVVERSRTPVSGAGQWNPGGNVDQVLSHEIAIRNRIKRAYAVVETLEDCRRAIGKLGEMVLGLTLIEGLTIKQVALRHGRANSADIYFWGETFRRTLEALADHWASPKARPPR